MFNAMIHILNCKTIGDVFVGDLEISYLGNPVSQRAFQSQIPISECGVVCFLFEGYLFYAHSNGHQLKRNLLSLID